MSSTLSPARPASRDRSPAQRPVLTDSIINGTGKLPDTGPAEAVRLAGLSDALQAEYPAEAQEMPQALLSLLTG